MQGDRTDAWYLVFSLEFGTSFNSNRARRGSIPFGCEPNRRGHGPCCRWRFLLLWHVICSPLTGSSQRPIKGAARENRDSIHRSESQLVALRNSFHVVQL